MLKARPEDVERFMLYVEKLPNGCWFWTGARSRGKGNRKWYGSFRLGKRTVRAHRFAAEVLGLQPCPDGHHRDHLCAFSLCVNPAHLETVTREENQARKMDDINRAPCVDATDPEALAAALLRLGHTVVLRGDAHERQSTAPVRDQGRVEALPGPGLEPGGGCCQPPIRGVRPR